MVAWCAVYTVYAPILLAPGAVLIKCSDFQRSLLARSISDPSVLATRGAYVFIFSLCCLLSVCNVFTTPRAGHQSRPLPLVFLLLELKKIKYKTKNCSRHCRGLGGPLGPPVLCNDIWVLLHPWP